MSVISFCLTGGPTKRPSSGPTKRSSSDTTRHSKRGTTRHVKRSTTRKPTSGKYTIQNAGLNA